MGLIYDVDLFRFVDFYLFFLQYVLLPEVTREVGLLPSPLAYFTLDNYVPYPGHALPPSGFTLIGLECVAFRTPVDVRRSVCCTTHPTVYTRFSRD